MLPPSNSIVYHYQRFPTKLGITKCVWGGCRCSCLAATKALKSKKSFECVCAVWNTKRGWSANCVGKKIKMSKKKYPQALVQSNPWGMLFDAMIQFHNGLIILSFVSPNFDHSGQVTHCDPFRI